MWPHGFGREVARFTEWRHVLVEFVLTDQASQHYNQGDWLSVTGSTALRSNCAAIGLTLANCMGEADATERMHESASISTK